MKLYQFFFLSLSKIHTGMHSLIPTGTPSRIYTETPSGNPPGGSFSEFFMDFFGRFFWIFSRNLLWDSDKNIFWILFQKLLTRFHLGLLPGFSQKFFLPKDSVRSCFRVPSRVSFLVFSRELLPGFLQDSFFYSSRNPIQDPSRSSYQISLGVPPAVPVALSFFYEFHIKFTQHFLR